MDVCWICGATDDELPMCEKCDEYCCDDCLRECCEYEEEIMHDGYTEQEFGSDGYTAKCSCGWVGEERSTEARALANLQTHYDQVGK